VIDRRLFIGTLAGGLLASPFPTFAQPRPKVPRIGVLGSERDSPPWQGFRQGLRDLGYVDGRNIAIEARWYEGKTDRIPTLAAELAESKVDVIVTSGTQAIRAVKQAASTTPIVMANSAYPDKIGLVDGLARPGGTITGLTNLGPELMSKSFQLLKEIAPKVSRVAVLLNPANPVEALGLKEILAAAPRVGMKIESMAVRTADDYTAAFAVVIASRADALFAFGNPVNFKNRQLIVEFALKSRLPNLFQERLFVEAGGLASYAPSYVDMFTRAATYVDKILKGAKPADLPVEQPSKFELVINATTAKALGISLPQSLLLLADEVIH
jgi:putative ABC transport system substrate-binding protein